MFSRATNFFRKPQNMENGIKIEEMIDIEKKFMEEYDKISKKVDDIEKKDKMDENDKVEIMIKDAYNYLLNGKKMFNNEKCYIKDTQKKRKGDLMIGDIVLYKNISQETQEPSQETQEQQPIEPTQEVNNYKIVISNYSEPYNMDQWHVYRIVFHDGTYISYNSFDGDALDDIKVGDTRVNIIPFKEAPCPPHTKGGKRRSNKKQTKRKNKKSNKSRKNKR